MKYRTKLFLGYLIVALLLSLSLGIVVYKISLNYETEQQENSLAVSSEQLVLQLEDRLNRMDAIIYYILSDQDMLNSIETLGMVTERSIPSSYVLNAQKTLYSGFNSEYIFKNSYRTVFYNECNYAISSYNANDGNRMAPDFIMNQISYHEKADLAKGKTVMVGSHEDVFGRKKGVFVYSVMKAVQGFQMGYIEIENTTESLNTLDVADSDTRFLILTDDSNVLYTNDDKALESNLSKKLQTMDNDETSHINGSLYSKRNSDQYGFSVITYVQEFNRGAGRLALVITALMGGILTFAFCFTLLMMFSYILAKPIREFRKTIEKTRLENLGIQEIQTTSHLDEIKMLTNSYISMTEKLNKAIKNEKRSLMLQMQAQFDTLQAQINPHFLYNVLNTISSRGIEDNDDMICEMCGALASLVRYSTNNKERYAHVSQEMQYLENYLYLLKARYGDKILFHMDVDKEVQDQLLPKMTLHQFVENVFAHGYSHSDRQMAVELTGRMYEDRWEICVRDNGEGISEEKLKEIREKIEDIRRKILENSGGLEMEIGGMGLVNTYARCLLLYNRNLIFSVENLSEGVEIKIGEMRRT
ncbi:MAG: histidine kinase [Blautia sp.]|nr:histidine kinase [Blautia sp.]